MDDAQGAVVGCIGMVVVVVVAPFVIAAIPILLGAAIGVGVVVLAGMFITAVVGAIFK
jgi:hypothetical protein